MKGFEREYQRVKTFLERYGNTVISNYADEIVERLQKEGIDVVVRESDEFHPVQWNNIYNYGSKKYIHNKIIERVKR